ncbi:MAG TPA: transcription termination factor Rho [Blastocatellia bacterium]|nr:transcription termination factor Rho [Blastocatellia bacterium]
MTDKPNATDDVATGVLELNEKGFGFLRKAKNNYLAGDDDIFVTPRTIQQFKLREGLTLTGTATMTEGSGGKRRSKQLDNLTSINGQPPEAYVGLKQFTELTSIDPTEILTLEGGSNTPEANLSMRVIDLVAPIGKGQRGLIVAAPKTGKTILIEQMAEAVSLNHPEVDLLVLLIDERPEEVTHLRRAVRGQVIASSSDMKNSNHIRVAHLVYEQARRMVEFKRDVVILLDSITRLGRASNREQTGKGRTLTGGVDSKALEFPRKFFGSARNIEGGGSLTIIASALVDTGSMMDEVIFQEFKGTGNMELILDRQLAERRIWPAIDITKSGTRKEEKLFPRNVLPKINMLRRGLAGVKPMEAMRLLLKGLEETETNEQFLEKLKL